MRKLKSIILSLIVVAIITACNTEEGLKPASQNSYIKIIKGSGSEVPLKIEQLSDENLIVVSNTSITQQGTTNEKIRVLKLNLDGEVIQPEAVFPKDSDEDWKAKEVIILSDGRIVVGGIAADTSLVFFSLDSNLEIVDFQYYKSDGALSYELNGFYYDESISKILFGGAEISDEDEYTFFGELEPSNFAVQNFSRTNKARALPSTTLFKDASGGLNWVYNSATSTLVRSSNSELTVIGDSELLDFDGATSITTKKLIGSEDDIMLFGEVKFNGTNSPTKIFQYRAYSSSEIIFGEEGNNHLNGVKKIDDGYLVTGTTEVQEEGANSQNDFLISKRGPNGSNVFTHSFGSDADEQLHDAVMINNKIFAIGSTIIGIDNSLLLLKMNEFGELKN